MENESVELNEEQQAMLEQLAEQKAEEKVAALKRKNDELLSEKKRVQQEREEALQRAKLQAEERAQADNDYKQLFESQKSETDSLRKTIEEMNANITKQKISSEAGKMAAQLTKDTQRAALLQKEISQRLTIVDNELRITDESGQLTVSSMDDLTNSIRTNYPFLVDGSQANGGGAARSEGRAEDRGKEISRADFEGMSQGQRAQFFSSGGTIFDE